MLGTASGLLALFLVFGLVAAPAENSEWSGAAWLDEPACERPRGADLTALTAYAATFPTVGRTETQGYLQWLEDEQAQAAVLRIRQVLDRHPGSFFGYYVDYILQAIVVTVEPAEADRSRLVSELDEAAGSAIQVIVRPACRSRADVEAARKVLQARDWSPNSGELNIGFYIDASNSRLVVSLPTDATAEAAILQTRFGDAVYVVWSADGLEHAFDEPEHAIDREDVESTTLPPPNATAQPGPEVTSVAGTTTAAQPDRSALPLIVTTVGALGLALVGWTYARRRNASRSQSMDSV